MKNCQYLHVVQINIWSYSGRKLLHSIETGHCANIFCTKFVPETSDELVVSGAGDAEVMFKQFNWYFNAICLQLSIIYVHLCFCRFGYLICLD